MDCIKVFMESYKFVNDLDPLLVAYLRVDCDEFFVVEFSRAKKAMCQVFSYNCGNFCGASIHKMCFSELIESGNLSQYISVFSFDEVQIRHY